jgi:arsenical pump membrane protein
MFEALGSGMALGARGRPRQLLAMVFLAAAATTAVLTLDATIVLLTPIVFATAARLRTNPRPHVYACSHLANTASLLLPVSNLTNLLAFRPADCHLPALRCALLARRAGLRRGRRDTCLAENAVLK